ncbi:hypothetical protein EJ03DRAFT_187057 [Teratosphaeria nubilosa]|uniref:Uncharacterized protein n=1 Tax=Teratosphaeria nubilosa TaxID=161662 RepID=A0A6G1LI51_9PEZI|nr:hypothetical protein EJ03DRAFT_187057 [Teratosphaeria nubilosa]
MHLQSDLEDTSFHHHREPGSRFDYTILRRREIYDLQACNTELRRCTSIFKSQRRESEGFESAKHLTRMTKSMILAIKATLSLRDSNQVNTAREWPRGILGEFAASLSWCSCLDPLHASYCNARARFGTSSLDVPGYRDRINLINVALVRNCWLVP